MRLAAHFARVNQLKHWDDLATAAFSRTVPAKSSVALKRGRLACAAKCGIVLRYNHAGLTVRASVIAVLLLPGLVLSLGAGAVFGLQLGLLAVWAGATLGETLAFLLGRYGAAASHLPICVPLLPQLCSASVCADGQYCSSLVIHPGNLCRGAAALCPTIVLDQRVQSQRMQSTICKCDCTMDTIPTHLPSSRNQQVKHLAFQCDERVPLLHPQYCQEPS